MVFISFIFYFFISIIIIGIWMYLYFWGINKVQKLFSIYLLKTENAEKGVVLRKFSWISQWIITVLYLFVTFLFLVNFKYNDNSFFIEGIVMILVTGTFTGLFRNFHKAIVGLLNYSFLTIKQKERVKSGMLFLRGFGQDNYDHEGQLEEERTQYRFSEFFFTKTANKLYPVFAVGMTKELNHPLGAKRFYLDDNSWKENVSELIQNAKFVFILAHNSDSCVWEIEESNNYLYKTFIFVDNIEEYSLIKAKSNICLPDLNNLKEPLLISWIDEKPITHHFENTDKGYMKIAEQIKDGIIKG